nr:hypothetical protein [Acinetobacter modestus]
MPAFFSNFLIIMGFILSVSGMIFSPHIFYNHIRSTLGSKALSFISMIPGVLILCVGVYINQ